MSPRTLKARLVSVRMGLTGDENPVEQPTKGIAALATKPEDKAFLDSVRKPIDVWLQKLDNKDLIPVEVKPEDLDPTRGGMGEGMEGLLAGGRRGARGGGHAGGPGMMPGGMGPGMMPGGMGPGVPGTFEDPAKKASDKFLEELAKDLESFQTLIETVAAGAAETRKNPWQKDLPDVLSPFRRLTARFAAIRAYGLRGATAVAILTGCQGWPGGAAERFASVAGRGERPGRMRRSRCPRTRRRSTRPQVAPGRWLDPMLGVSDRLRRKPAAGQQAWRWQYPALEKLLAEPARARRGSGRRWRPRTRSPAPTRRLRWRGWAMPPARRN